MSFFLLLSFSLTTSTSVLSPVLPVPGVGQVGQGLQNTWGLEEEEEDDEEEALEEDDGGEEQVEEVMKIDEEPQTKDRDTREGY